MEIKSSKAASIADAKDILSKRKEKGELGYEQSQALDNCEKSAKLTAAKTSALAAKIAKIGKMNEELAIKIADISPSGPATLRAILAKDKVEASEEEIAQILKELS